MLISLDMAKQFLRIPNSEADTLIQELLSGLESWVERFLDTSFSTKAFTEKFSGDGPFLVPKLLPIVSVSKITDCWFAEDLETTEYSVESLKIRRIWSDFPVPWEEGFERWEVTGIAGYNNNNEGAPPAGSVSAPAGLRSAVLVALKQLYDSPGIQSQSYGPGIQTMFEGFELSSQVKQLLLPFRLHSGV